MRSCSVARPRNTWPCSADLADRLDDHLRAVGPTVLGHGAGSELRLPLGISVIGGLLLSQFVTLYTTPVIYLAMEAVRAWVAGLVHGPASSSAPAE